MKKVKILISALAVALLGLTAASCDRDPISFESSNSRNMEAVIYFNEWRDYVSVDGSGNVIEQYKYVSYDWDAISSDVLNYGTVTAYVKEHQSDRQNQLPFVYPLGWITYDDGTQLPLIENLRYDIEPGKITFIMQDLDGDLPQGLENTPPLTFRAIATVPVQYVINK